MFRSALVAIPELPATDNSSYTVVCLQNQGEDMSKAGCPGDLVCLPKNDVGFGISSFILALCFAMRAVFDP